MTRFFPFGTTMLQTLLLGGGGDAVVVEDDMYAVVFTTEGSWTVPDSATPRYFGLAGRGSLTGPSLDQGDQVKFVVPATGNIVRAIAYAEQSVGATVGSGEATELAYGIDGVFTAIGDLDFSTITPPAPSTVVDSGAISVAVAAGDYLGARVTPAAAYATNPDFVRLVMVLIIKED